MVRLPYNIYIWTGRIQVYLNTNRQNTNMLKEVYLNTNRETTILLHILEGGEGVWGQAGPRGWWCWAFIAVCGWWCWALIAICMWWYWALVCCSWCWSLVVNCRWCCWGLVIFCGWRGWALVALFMGGGVVPSSVFMWHGPLSPSWWSCHRSRERVVGHSCLWTLHPLSSCIGILRRFCVLSSCVLVVMCPHHCCMSLIIVMCPRRVVVPCPPCWYPVMLLLPCPRCDVLFDCHAAVGDMAPVVKRWLGGGRWAYSPQLIVACVRMWLLAVIHEPWFYVGGHLHLWVVSFVFWVVVVAVQSLVVKSVVGSGDKHGWWWWEEKSWPCLVSMMPNKHCLFGPCMWDHHMYDLTWWSWTHPMEIHQMFHGFQFFFHGMGSDSVWNYKT